MNSRQALAVAVFFIFGAALIVEFSGAVDHARPATTAAATGDSGAEGNGQIELKEYDEATLRNGVLGAFMLLCVLMFMRMRGDWY